MTHPSEEPHVVAPPPRDRAHPRGGRAWEIALGVALAFLAVVSVASLQYYARASSDELLDRFDTRVGDGARFVGVFLDELAEQTEVMASRRLDGEVGTDDVDGANGDLGAPFGIVLDHSGRLLAAAPPRADLLDRDLAATYDHLAEAVAGRSSASDVVTAAGLDVPLVALAVPYATPSGQRVYSIGFRPDGTPVERFLADLQPLDGVRSYLVDGNGRLILSPSDVGATQFADAEGTLAAAIDEGGAHGAVARTGEYVDDGTSWHWARHPVPGTAWTLVSTVQEPVLLGPVGVSRWLARVGLVFVALGLALGVLLLWRLAQRDRSLLATNQALDEALRSRAMFIDVASHELRTPVTVIHGFLETLAERWEDLDPAVRRTLVERCRNNSDRLTALVEDVLEVSRLQVRRRAAPVTTVTVADLVDEAVADSSAETALVAVTCAPDLTVVTDPVAARRVLRNLLDNAVRYGADPITVRATPEPRGVAIAVHDAGPGVPEHFLPFLFEPFTQSQDTDLHTQGSGLGLSIARGLALELGGDLTHEPGPGATFVLRLVDVDGDGASRDETDANRRQNLPARPSGTRPSG